VKCDAKVQEKRPVRLSIGFWVQGRTSTVKDPVKFSLRDSITRPGFLDLHLPA
jgi:hypothetical protein